MGVTQFAQDLDLSEGGFPTLDVHEFESIIDLNGDFLSCRLVNGFLYDCIGSVTDLLAKGVVRDV